MIFFNSFILRKHGVKLVIDRQFVCILNIQKPCFSQPSFSPTDLDWGIILINTASQMFLSLRWKSHRIDHKLGGKRVHVVWVVATQKSVFLVYVKVTTRVRTEVINTASGVSYFSRRLSFSRVSCLFKDKAKTVCQVVWLVSSKNPSIKTCWSSLKVKLNCVVRITLLKSLTVIFRAAICIKYVQIQMPNQYSPHNCVKCRLANCFLHFLTVNKSVIGKKAKTKKSQN